MNKRITDIMIAQHALIESLFRVFKDEREGSPQKAIFLKELASEAKKHFSIEEQAIFALLPWKNGEIFEMTNRLKREHHVMIKKLESGSIDDSFSEMIHNHRQTEEKDLYPLLDEKLSPEEKKLIIARINEMPFGPVKNI